MLNLEPKELAAQLRSPHGEHAIEVGEFMKMANANLYHKFVEYFSPLNKQSILEIGPGNGAHISKIISCGSDINYTSIDLSPEMVLEAKANNIELIATGKINILEGNCRKMKFSPDSFDQVLGFNTVYFWDPHETYLDEIKRVLKPDGRLILCYRTKKSMLDMPFSKFGFTLYDQEDLESMLTNCGFKTVSSRSFFEDIETPDGRKARLEAVFTLASSF